MPFILETRLVRVHHGHALQHGRREREQSITPADPGRSGAAWFLLGSFSSPNQQEFLLFSSPSFPSVPLRAKGRPPPVHLKTTHTKSAFSAKKGARLSYGRTRTAWWRPRARQAEIRSCGRRGQAEVEEEGCVARIAGRALYAGSLQSAGRDAPPRAIRSPGSPARGPGRREGSVDLVGAARFRPFGSVWADFGSSARRIGPETGVGAIMWRTGSPRPQGARNDRPTFENAAEMAFGPEKD